MDIYGNLLRIQSFDGFEYLQSIPAESGKLQNQNFGYRILFCIGYHFLKSGALRVLFSTAYLFSKHPLHCPSILFRIGGKFYHLALIFLSLSRDSCINNYFHNIVFKTQI